MVGWGQNQSQLTGISNKVDVAHECLAIGLRQPREVAAADADGDADVTMRVNVVVVVEAGANAAGCTHGPRRAATL